MAKIDKLIRNMTTPRSWFNVKKDDETCAEILIYDQIGADFWGEGLTPTAFVNELKAIEKTHKSVDIRINSPGGYIHDGFTIYNHMAQSPLNIDIYIDGMAASAASFIAMGGDKIYMPPAAEMMIHDPWSVVVGSAADMRTEAEHLDNLKSMIAGIYAKKTGMSEKEINELMKNETWMDGKKAVELGFADELMENSKAAACVFELDSELFPNLPENFLNYQNALRKRIQEKALRDAGLSHAAAKATVNRRDAEADFAEIQDKAINLIKENLKCLTM